MTVARYTLVIGTKSWSSWSLRPWLLMRQFGIPFREDIIPLRSPDTAAAIARLSPSGKVPALIDDDVTVWDSLGIIEYLAEAHPELAIWPRDRAARTLARCASAEMHSGFVALRQNCPMDVTARRLAPADPAAIAPDVARIVAIWRDCRTRFGSKGPYLFGAFSATDAIYAPVVSRALTYGLDLTAVGDTDGLAARYRDAIWQLPALTDWCRDASASADSPAAGFGAKL